MDSESARQLQATPFSTHALISYTRDASPELWPELPEDISRTPKRSHVSTTEANIHVTELFTASQSSNDGRWPELLDDNEFRITDWAEAACDARHHLTRLDLEQRGGK
jgi:hypothetical protein